MFRSFKSASLLLAAVTSLFILSFDVLAQGSLADLDRDGIPNIRDRDVDNDGIPNLTDRNIDGGIAKSGPRRGRYIGDQLNNNSPQEMDMDADGMADDALAESDIDGDGLLDGERQETDIDGDGLADNAITETDIDGDGRPDHASEETDIDGDGLIDGVLAEADIDGDGRANGLDGDVDGDGTANSSDSDMYGTGMLNDIFAGTDAAYAQDDAVASIIAFVSGEIRRTLQIPSTDTGLRVRVSATQFGSLVTGVWRYLSSDNIQVYANWSYPVDNPSDIKISVIYRYNGPYSGNWEDYTNPANYSISDESRVYSQYPGGGLLFVSWLDNEPAGFFFSAIFQGYVSKAQNPASSVYANGSTTGDNVVTTSPYQALINALGSMPNLTSDPQYLTFSGNFSATPGLPSLQPVINLQRTVMQVVRTWRGNQEAALIR